MILNQGGDFAPRRILVMSADIFVSYNGEGAAGI